MNRPDRGVTTPMKRRQPFDSMAKRKAILALVKEMASEFPHADYCSARERFGLLSKISRLCDNVMPTAAQCWEHVGLVRSHLVDEFEFAQLDACASASRQIIASQGAHP